MAFAHDIAGGQGNLIAESLQSPNFSLSPFRGWKMTRDGTLYAASVVIPPGAAGNQIFAQGTTPVAANVGDLWINTASGNAVSVWNGSAWTPYQWGTSAIGSGAITAPLIAANTITAGQLAAGIIYAGIVNGTTITGATIVADGTSGQILVYSGAPAAGNLIASVSGAAGTDSHTNAYLAGITAYFTTIGGITYALNANAGGGYVPLTWYLNSGSGFVSVATIASVLASGLTLDSSASGSMTLNAGTNSIVLDSPVQATAGAAATPTLITTDNWHTITLDAGWTTVETPQYRLLPDGNVQVRGQISHAATTAAVNINSGAPVPSLYWPAAARYFRPSDAGQTAGTVQMSTAGVFAMRASGFSATEAILDGMYSI